MKKKIKIITIIFSCLVLAAIAGYLVIGSPVVFINNQKLENSVKSIDSDAVKLNDIVPFYWDTVYTFRPYMSKESMEDIVGFKSDDIKENNINEGMVHLLFVKEKKVAASILGYSANLGYSFVIPSKVTFAENADFRVENSDGVITLTYIE